MVGQPAVDALLGVRQRVAQVDQQGEHDGAHGRQHRVADQQEGCGQGADEWRGHLLDEINGAGTLTQTFEEMP